MKEKELDDVPKKNSMAFKASIESNDSDVEDDLALISHKFKKFLKEGRSQKKWHRSSNKKNKRKKRLFMQHGMIMTLQLIKKFHPMVKLLICASW